MDRRQFLGTSLGVAGAMSVAGTATRASAAQKESVENTPVILECAINGSVAKAKNPRAPATAEEHAEEMIRCLNAGATIIHTHSNEPNEDVQKAALFYIESFRPVREQLPHAILYATANFDPVIYNRERRAWPGKVQCGHQRILAEEGICNMVLFDTGVVPIGVYDNEGVPGPDSAFWWYGFWPDDVKYILQTCKDTGAGASISVFEPGWMKNVVAMAKAGTIPRGSKLNIYFAAENMPLCAPPTPEALELYLKMMEGFDFKWAVGYIGDKSVMDTPLARLALERGGSFRVGLEDWPNGTSNVEQLKRAKEMISAVGRSVVTGAEAIKYLDIPYARTRP
jgi:3-keto-5-aminohexanoate cleavage enzyme